MKWYETQLFAGILGALVGGLLVFVSNEFHRLFERRRSKRNLMAGMRAEIRVQEDFLDFGLTQLQTLGDELAESGKIKLVYRFAGEYRMQFLETNLERLGLLDERIIEKAIELLGIMAATKTGTQTLEETIPKFQRGRVSKEVLDGQLASAMLSYKKMIALGKEITFLIESQVLTSAEKKESMRKLLNSLRSRWWSRP